MNITLRPEISEAVDQAWATLNTSTKVTERLHTTGGWTNLPKTDVVEYLLWHALQDFGFKYRPYESIPDVDVTKVLGMLGEPE